jgi:hypothetical protein
MWPFQIAADKRQRRLVVWVAVCLSMIFFGAGLWFFTPYSEELWLCDICGKRKVTLIVLGVKCYGKEFDNELFAWYCSLHLPPHTHQWTLDCANVRRWNGQVTCYDTFCESLGGVTYSLRRFQEASTKMDQADVEDCAREYNAIGQDQARNRQFLERLEKILPSARTLENGSR